MRFAPFPRRAGRYAAGGLLRAPRRRRHLVQYDGMERGRRPEPICSLHLGCEYGL